VKIIVQGLALESELNVREHFRVKAARKASVRAVVAAHLAAWTRTRRTLEGPLVVTITRVAPALIRDDDNLVSCGKHVRDEVAAWLGLDDSDARVRWVVAQRRRAFRKAEPASLRYATEIAIEQDLTTACAACHGTGRCA
jgi:hypothetical protein